MGNILSKIVQLPFPKTEYIQEEYTKNQIVLHHTVSGDNAKAVADYWASTSGRVATCIIVDRKGIPYQIYPSTHWAGHIGVKQEVFTKLNIPYKNLDKTSIGVELCNWGGLTLKNGKYFNYYGTEVSGVDVIEYKNGFRGFNYFQKYTAEQIQTTKELLLYWNSIYKIPLTYNDSIWDVYKNALIGNAGVYVHVSYRSDKSDLHPQPEIIQMLKSLV